MRGNFTEAEKGIIRVNNAGIRFTLAHQKDLTMKEAFINMVKRQHEKRTLWALREVTFNVPRGERIGIIGSNGSGKSTLLRLLAGVYRPDEGTVAVGGRIGALIDLSAGLHGDLRGEENIYLNAAILGMPRNEVKRVFDSIVEFSGLEDFIYQPVKFYSSGMKLRLGFSTAVHMKPDVLLVDEVIAVGDEDFKRKCYAKMDEMRDNQVTTVIVSHDLNLIKRFCLRTMWIDKGKIRDIASPEEIISSYKKARVK